MFTKGFRFLLLVVLITAFSTINIVSANEDESRTYPGQANDIDFAFEQPISHASTVERNYLSEKFLAAWQREFNNVATLLNEQYQHSEDKETLSNYIYAVDKMALETGNLAWLNWTDFSMPIKGRSIGSGASSESLLGKVSVYREATYQLIYFYEKTTNKKYEYIFKVNEDDFKILEKQ